MKNLYHEVLGGTPLSSGCFDAFTFDLEMRLGFDPVEDQPGSIRKVTYFTAWRSLVPAVKQNSVVWSHIAQPRQPSSDFKPENDQFVFGKPEEVSRRDLELRHFLPSLRQMRVPTLVKHAEYLFAYPENIPQECKIAGSEIIFCGEVLFDGVDGYAPMLVFDEQGKPKRNLTRIRDGVLSMFKGWICGMSKVPVKKDILKF